MSTAIAAFEFAKARLTGEEPKLGEDRKVTVEMSAHEREVSTHGEGRDRASPLSPY